MTPGLLRFARTVSVHLSNLRDVPFFLDRVAHAVWTAFWRESGRPPTYILERATEALETAPVPFCLVAHEGDRFFGTASVIVSDVEGRPELTPWLAAVWVEESRRGRGIGSALVGRAAHDAFALGVPVLYLCAAPGRRGFYERLGWSVVEENAPRQGQTIMSRRRA